MADNISPLLDGLLSTKMRERKKCYEVLFSYLEKPNVTKSLDESEDQNWNSVFFSAKKALYAIHEKISTDNAKGTSPKNNILEQLRTSNDLVHFITKCGNRKDGKIEFDSYYKYLRKCKNTNILNKHCFELAMNGFREYILPQNSYWGSINSNLWIEIFQMMKQLHEENRGFKSLECIFIMIQKGLRHAIPLANLTNESIFLTTVFEKLKGTSPKWYQETSLKIFIEFCELSCDDQRLLCCNLGENILPTFVQLYPDCRAHTNITYLMFKTIAQQMRIHHPNGVLQGDENAMAGCWTNWNSTVRYVYTFSKELITSREKFLIDSDANCLHSAFLEFAVEVFHQIVNMKDAGIVPVSTSDDAGPSSKRMCHSYGISFLIEQFETSRDWMWISLLTEILRKYPSSIESVQYEKFLKYLVDFIPECKTSELRGHVILCLSVLFSILTIYEDKMDKNIIEHIYPSMWNFAIKSIGLNQNQTEMHNFLQSLIQSKQPLQYYKLQLLNTYLSKTVMISLSSLKTLELFGEQFDIPDSLPNQAESPRVILIQWLLQVKRNKFFDQLIVATLLIHLTFNQWPKESIRYNEYFIGNNVQPLSALNAQKQVINKDVSNILVQTLKAVKNETLMKNAISDIIDCATLFANIMSVMKHYSIRKDRELVKEMLLEILALQWNTLETLYGADKIKIKEEKSVIEKLTQLFVIDNHIDSVVRSTITRNLVKLFCNILSTDDEEESEQTERKKGLLKVLCKYCISAKDEVQTTVLNVLANFEVDPLNKVEYQMALIILNCLKEQKEQYSIEILEQLFGMIKKICIKKFESYEVTLDVLNVVCILFNQVAEIRSLRSDFLQLLKTFYDIKESYGPKVSILLCKCIKRIVLVDPTGQWSQFSSQDDSRNVAFYLPLFLNNSSHRVRMTAVDCFEEIFALQNTSNNAIYIKQKELFDEISSVCCQMFQRDFDSNDYNERFNYQLTAYGILSVIVIKNCNLRQQALFLLLRITKMYQLGEEKLQSTLKGISTKLTLPSTCELLEDHLSYLLTKWSSYKYSLADFPIHLFGCNDTATFYKKYTSHIIPILINEGNRTTFESVCDGIGKTTEEVIELAYPKITAKSLISKILSQSRNSDDIPLSQNIVEKIENYLTDDLNKKMATEQLHKIIVQLIEFVFDLSHFNRMFKVKYAMPTPDTSFLTVNLFLNTLELLKEQINAPTDELIEHLIDNEPRKLQELLLTLKCNIHKPTSIEDKLLALHHYLIVVEAIKPYLTTNRKMTPFLIKDICYSLIYFVQSNSENDDIFNQLAATYFATFLDDILPDNANIFVEFLVVFVSTLVSIANTDSKVGQTAFELLNKIIIKNGVHLKNGIQILDPLPDTPEFANLRKLCLNIKYNDNKTTYDLKTEIDCFLKVGEYIKVDGCRFEGLKHLQKQLSQKTSQLKELYENLYQMKGCLEPDSAIHKLVWMLVQLSKSTDKNEALEALKCLGELGPANLTTIVLRDENNDDLLSPQYAIKFLINTLLEYTVDKNHNVAANSSSALHQVLSSQESKHYINSAEQLEYLYPFINNVTTTTKLHTKLNEGQFIQIITNEALWCLKTEIAHSVWITNLVGNILDTFTEKSYYRTLIPVIRSKVSFAEKVFSIIINVILKNSKGMDKHISKSFSKFFEQLWVLYWSTGCTGGTIPEQKAAVKCMLNTVQYCQLQNKSTTTNSRMLELNYLHVALAAKYCSAYCSAAMYSELWCREQAASLYSTNVKNGNLTVFDLIREHSEYSKELETILKQSYIDIGDQDALHYEQRMDPFCVESQINAFKDLNCWDIATLLDNVKNQPSITTELQDQVDKISWKTHWRLCKWDTMLPTKIIDSTNFHYCNYLALRAFNEYNEMTFNEAVEAARYNVQQELRHESLETCEHLYLPMTRLQCLKELEEVYYSNEEDFNTITSSWMSHDMINQNKFQYIEPILAHRISILKVLIKRGLAEANNVLVDTLLTSARIARNDGNLSNAKRTIANILCMENIDDSLKHKVILEDAQITWKINEELGTRILKTLLKKCTDNNSTRSEALLLYGSWMVQSKAESAKDIIYNYFLKAINFHSSLQNSRSHRSTRKEIESFYNANDTLAKFADIQYQEISRYAKSPICQEKIQNMEKLIKFATEMKNSSVKNEDVKRSIVICERQSTLDSNEVKNTQKEKDTYLKLAVKYYLYNLQLSAKNDISIFRIFSLWLENKTNVALSKGIAESLAKTPSYKALQILPQIVPHIGATDSSDLFSNALYKLVERCALEHPHHALPIILSVANSNKDSLYGDTSASSDNNEPRIEAALKIIQNLKTNASLKNIITEMEALAEAFMELAYYITPNFKSSNTEVPVKIPRKCKIYSISNLTHALLPTVPFLIRPNGNYEHVVGIQKFHNEFNYVGGVTAPKKIKCLGTDGIVRAQLLKGKDDLRQDAVMQQVFTIINELLTSNKATSNLTIRTYKIVPLSKRSGVLEWVSNSMKLGDYLNKAHKTYNPEDISPERCRSELMTIAKASNEDKLKKYLDICKKFRPVFHKFFEVNYLHPPTWYEKRRAYTQSVATTSMCGYILGLGDRHVTNILIDQTTAEVVHIDFGIAFEQGKVLPTPETIPFRLTRDIEAGMGIFGYDGIFRRSCEKTMDVLRKNMNTIVAILEVLLYDPLYEWTITPAQAYNHQLDSDSDGASDHLVFSNEDKAQINVRAERALNRLREKLQGTESGGFMSVEGQVTWLIQEARSPANLSRLYSGWQPYF